MFCFGYSDYWLCWGNREDWENEQKWSHHMAEKVLISFYNHLHNFFLSQFSYDGAIDWLIYHFISDGITGTARRTPKARPATGESLSRMYPSITATFHTNVTQFEYIYLTSLRLLTSSFINGEYRGILLVAFIDSGFCISWNLISICVVTSDNIFQSMVA